MTNKDVYFKSEFHLWDSLFWKQNIPCNFSSYSISALKPPNFIHIFRSDFYSHENPLFSHHSTFLLLCWKATLLGKDITFLYTSCHIFLLQIYFLLTLSHLQLNTTVIPNIFIAICSGKKLVVAPTLARDRTKDQLKVLNPINLTNLQQGIKVLQVPCKK